MPDTHACPGLSASALLTPRSQLSSAEAMAKSAQSEQRELRAAVERQAWVTSWAETLAREQSLASLRQRLTASTTR